MNCEIDGEKKKIFKNPEKLTVKALLLKTNDFLKIKKSPNRSLGVENIKLNLETLNTNNIITVSVD